ncbi:MAG: sigma-54-dependent transcriptional regulator [Paracoccaceae bacterium]
MPSPTPVAVVDDEADMRQSIAQWLNLSGFAPRMFDSAEAALGEVGLDFPGVVVSDIKMPVMDGMALLRRLHTIDSTLPVVLITGHGDVPMAVEAMQIGAFDFIEKPFHPERLLELVKRAVETRRLTLDNRALRRELSDGSVLLRRLVGSSEVISALREDILDLAQADGHVLVTGETGTGKSLIARALHACGPRQRKPFISINCAALPEPELEAALFGPVENAGSKPAMDKIEGGTLCLEDIQALGPALQARLLGFLDGSASIDRAAPSFRLISVMGSNDTEDTMPETLRRDFFFRLSALQITAPPLRERGEDILQLFGRFAAQFADEYGCEPPELNASEAGMLLQAPWPGNVRQLINLAERVVLQSRRGENGISTLLRDEAGEMIQPVNAAGVPLKEHVEAFERMVIENALRRNHGSVARVIEDLMVPRRTLTEKRANAGLSRGDYV